MKGICIKPSEVAAGLEEMHFETLANFNSGSIGVFWSGPGGPSPWEMHPDCDELLQVLEGEIEVEILPEGTGSPSKTKVPAGSFVVIPQGCWHRQTLLRKTRELYLTPGQTQHSTNEDPRHRE